MLCFFFFNDTATTEIYTLSLHDALPILGLCGADMGSAWLLPRIVGRGNAMQLLLFGDIVKIGRAHV